LATELERRRKRAERFGVELSDADKKLQRAARFGTTVSDPLDAPLTGIYNSFIHIIILLKLLNNHYHL